MKRNEIDDDEMLPLSKKEKRKIRRLEKEERRNNRPIWLKAVIVMFEIFIYMILIAIGLAFVFRNEVAYKLTDFVTHTPLIDRIHSNSKTANDEKVSYNVSKIKPYDALSSVKSVIESKNVQANGQLSVPSVGINLPIYSGINDVHLYLGAAEIRSRSNVKAGQVGNYSLVSYSIYSHGTLFEPLSRINQNEKIYVATDNKVFVYNVTSIDQTDDDEIEKWLDTETDGQKLITLYSYSNKDQSNLRWVCRGELESEYNINSKIPKEIIKSFVTRQNSLKDTYLEKYKSLKTN